jgi:hypothetical protein
MNFNEVFGNGPLTAMTAQRVADWYRANIRFEFVTLLPLTARRLRETQPPGFNRDIIPSNVAKLQGAALRGSLVPSPQGIAVDSRGIVIDGNNRLTAIEQSGVPVVVLVSYGWPPETFQVIDRGVKRSVADVFRVARQIGASANYLTRLLYDTAAGDDQIQRVLYFAGDTFMYLLDGAKRGKSVMASAPVLVAAALRILDGGDPKWVRDTYHNIVALNFDALTSTGNAFMRQILEKKARTTKGHDLFVRAVAAFDPARQNLQKIQVKDVAATTGEVRAAFRQRVDSAGPRALPAAAE